MKLVLAARVLLAIIILPSAMGAGNLVGTTTRWSIDADIDGTLESMMEMTNVTSIGDNLSASALRCVLTFSNGSGPPVTMPGSVMSWNGVDLVIDDMSPFSENEITVILGVSRRYITRVGEMNGVNTTFVHDRETGLLVSAYSYNGTCGCSKVVTIAITSTNAFTTVGPVIEPMTWIVIAVIAAAIIYTAYVTTKDRKLRKTKACFGQDCWD